MGPEYLVAIAFIGGALLVGASAYGGWSARAKVSEAVTALQEARIEGLMQRLADALQHAEAQAKAGRAVVDAAERRATHDAVSDPLGLGLLLGGQPLAAGEGGSDVAGGEANSGGDGSVGAGVVSAVAGPGDGLSEGASSRDSEA